MTESVGGGERLDLLGRHLPPWLEVRVVVIPPGDRLAYEQAAWRGALLEVDCGELDIEFDSGIRCRLGAGTLFWLDGLAPQALRNRGHQPAVLVAVARRQSAGGWSGAPANAGDEESPPNTMLGMSPSASQTLDVIARRTYSVPVEAVWAAWTEPEVIRRWWGPEGFTCPLARMDVRAGGVSLLAMQAPPQYGGGRTYTTWSYSVVEPMARLEYVVRFADEAGTTISPAEAGIPPGVPDAVPHLVTFTPTAEGGTELSITESGYTASQARDMSQNGLDQCLDKLAVVLAGSAATEPSAG